MQSRQRLATVQRSLKQQIIRAVGAKVVARQVALPSVSQAASQRRFHATPVVRSPSARRPLSSVQYQLLKWVDAYRVNGHLFADINPLHGVKRESHDRSVLDPASYGLNPNDTISTVGVVTMPNGATEATVDEIRAHLESIYCAAIGVETQHVATDAERDWLNSYLESANVSTLFSVSEKRNILGGLVQSEFFDHFMGKKFTSFKRYGLEGAEAALVAMEEILVRTTRAGYERVVIGMPHRGRLNLLVSLLDYPARALFAKVKGRTLVPHGMDAWDDVASHIAQTVTKKFDKAPGAKPLTVSLLHNPSHLEAVNPVAIGKVKAKQDDYALPRAEAVEKVLSLQLHGDSAYAGQGVVPETLQMAYLNEFSVGGTVHMIVNNQLGFTTGGVGRNRSSRYSSDIGKIISMPVVHVNAESPEHVAFAARLVSDFQKTFHKDIMLDIIGYRKHGHNEVDEPAFTQPLMYQDIRARRSVVQVYTEKLVREGVLDSAVTNPHEKLLARLNAHLEKELAESNTYEASANEHFQGKWNGYGQTKDCTDVVETGVPVETLKQIGEDSVRLPEGFTVHPRLKRGHIDARLSALRSSKPDIDWATAECMAFESLVRTGYNVRLCGQDVERGTFSQRHHVLTDQKTGLPFEPLNAPGVRPSTGTNGRFQTVNSHLSEEAVLGFEFGYSWESPSNMNVWEAQFGDFNNGAQIMIDTFLQSTESKWLRQTGLTMLLPHGYDGAGPEHSSSRVERFLQVVDDEHDLPVAEGALNGGGSPKTNSVNMLVANVTTPANYFHLLRRQMLRQYRKPLVVITPKTLLRHAEAVSSLEEMAPGTHFQTVMGDVAAADFDAASVRTVVLVTGKVYYDLVARRAEAGRRDIVFVRLEELCPFPAERLVSEVSKYSAAKRLLWFQEEPSNAGAWTYVAPRIAFTLNNAAQVEYVGRAALPSPAVGAAVYHKKEVEDIYRRVFA